MKAITIKQPWASLIVHGIKDIENRTWRTNFRGRVLIHSSAKGDIAKFGCLQPNQRLKVLNTPMSCIDFNDLPFGSIIGSVEIVDCVQNYPSIWADKGVYNWILANPVLFPEPISAKGKLSFWEYPNINSEDDICLCNLVVNERNQVVSYGEYYRCAYCGSKWSK